jgi:Ca2+-binding RTX toxin-like protein
MKPGKALCIALLACAVVPAPAAASVAQVTAAGELRFDGAPGEENKVTILYKQAAEAGFNGASDRFVIEDSVAIQAGSDTCVNFPTSLLKITCDARPVTSITAFLGDADDVLAVDKGGADEVSGRYPVLARGGTGNDVIRSGTADDRLYGEAGRDVVAGWLGDDLLSGGPGTDALIGYAGDDRLLGGAGPDVLFAQKGHDRLIGGGGKNVLAAKDGQRDPVINCGGGGAALTDPRDPKPHGCARPRSKKK